MSTPTVYVEIVAYADDKVIERRGPFTQWKADKIDDGLNINLNHDAYYTRFVTASEPKETQ